MWAGGALGYFRWKGPGHVVLRKHRSKKAAYLSFPHGPHGPEGGNLKLYGGTHLKCLRLRIAGFLPRNPRPGVTTAGRMASMGLGIGESYQPRTGYASDSDKVVRLSSGQGGSRHGIAVGGTTPPFQGTGFQRECFGHLKLPNNTFTTVCISLGFEIKILSAPAKAAGTLFFVAPSGEEAVICFFAVPSGKEATVGFVFAVPSRSEATACYLYLG